jgi:hypothetical protein
MRAKNLFNKLIRNKKFNNLINTLTLFLTCGLELELLKPNRVGIEKPELWRKLVK